MPKSEDIKETTINSNGIIKIISELMELATGVYTTVEIMPNLNFYPSCLPIAQTAHPLFACSVMAYSLLRISNGSALIFSADYADDDDADMVEPDLKFTIWDTKIFDNTYRKLKGAYDIFAGSFLFESGSEFILAGCASTALPALFLRLAIAAFCDFISACTNCVKLFKEKLPSSFISKQKLMSEKIKAFADVCAKVLACTGWTSLWAGLTFLNPLALTIGTICVAAILLPYVLKYPLSACCTTLFSRTSAYTQKPKHNIGFDLIPPNGVVPR